MIDTTSIVMTKAPRRLKAKAPIQNSIPEQPQLQVAAFFWQTTAFVFPQDLRPVAKNGFIHGKDYRRNRRPVPGQSGDHASKI
jgi:hypothetical protein